MELIYERDSPLSGRVPVHGHPRALSVCVYVCICVYVCVCVLNIWQSSGSLVYSLVYSVFSLATWQTPDLSVCQCVCVLVCICVCVYPPVCVCVCVYVCIRIFPLQFPETCQSAAANSARN